MAKKKRRNQAQGTVELPTLSEIFEPLKDGWQNIGDSLVWDPNAQEDFGQMMTVKDAKKFRKEYSDPTDRWDSGALDNKFESSDIESDLTTQAEDREKQNLVQTPSPTWSVEEPDTTGLNDADTVSVVQKAAFNRKQNAEKLEQEQTQYLKSLASFGTNATYTTNYRDAIKSGSGWKAFYDDSPDPDNPIRRSDVFTIGEDGNPLGVMTRSQRRRYDERMHEARMNAMNAEKDGAIEREENEGGQEGQPVASKQQPESVTKKVEDQSKSTPTFKSAAETANKEDDNKIR